MDKRFAFLFGSQHGSSTFAETVELARAQVSERDENLAEMLSEYDKHLESLETKGFAEALEEFGMIEELSTNNYPQIRIGEGLTVLARNSRAAINALVSLAAGKYQELDEEIREAVHVAWFDPRRDAEGIASVKVNGEWTFFDGMNGDTVPSKMSDNRRRFQSAKHEEINRLMRCEKNKTAYVIVLNRQEELDHFQERVKGRLELSIPELYEALANDAQAAKTVRKLYGQGVTNNPSRPVDHSELQGKIKPGVILVFNTKGVINRHLVTEENVDGINLNNLSPATTVTIEEA